MRKSELKKLIKETIIKEQTKKILQKKINMTSKRIKGFGDFLRKEGYDV